MVILFTNEWLAYQLPINEGFFPLAGIFSILLFKRSVHALYLLSSLFTMAPQTRKSATTRQVKHDPPTPSSTVAESDDDGVINIQDSDGSEPEVLYAYILL